MRDDSISRCASFTSRFVASSFSWSAERDFSRAASSRCRPSRDSTRVSTSPSRFRRDASFASTAACFFSTLSIAASASAIAALFFRRSWSSTRDSLSSPSSSFKAFFVSRSAAVLADSSSFTRDCSPWIVSSWRAICAVFASDSLRASSRSLRNWASRAFASSRSAASTFSKTGASSSSSLVSRDFRAFSRSPIGHHNSWSCSRSFS